MGNETKRERSCQTAIEEGSTSNLCKTLVKKPMRKFFVSIQELKDTLNSFHPSKFKIIL